MDTLLSEGIAQELDGVLSCDDRVVISGNLQPLCYAQGMTRYLYQKGIRIFDYAKFAEPFRERIRENAENLAEENEIKIEFIRKKRLAQRSACARDIENTRRTAWFGTYFRRNGGL
jgi:hypothetical protein